MGGGDGKVPVLTAMLMASTCFFFLGGGPLDPSTQTTVNILLL